MYKRPITYTDYDGNERTEDFYFNLNKAELMEMELSVSGGLEQKMKKLVASRDGGEIMRIFKEIILKAYGEKSPDGKRFVKSPEMSTAFEQTEAYNVLFVELVTNADAASDFINKIIPPVPESERLKAQAKLMEENPDIAKLYNSIDK